MRSKQLAAVVICTAMVAAAYIAWDRATAGFNPNPVSTTLKTSSSCLPSSPGCPAFSIDSANLTVRDLSDVTSQELTLRVRATGASPIGRMAVLFSGVLVDNSSAAVEPGASSTISIAIPTIIQVEPGARYTVTVEATSAVSGSHQGSEAFWSAVQVTAS